MLQNCIQLQEGGTISQLFVGHGHGVQCQLADAAVEGNQQHRGK